MINGFGRLAVILWLCAVAGQAIVLFAFYSALSEAHDEEVVARLSALANRVAVTANERATIGFPLGFQQDLQRVIETVVRDGSVSLYVCDPKRQILFATDPDSLGELASASWLVGAEATGSRSWQVVDNDGIEVGMPVNDGFGHRSGVVIARAPKQSARVALLAVLQQTASVSLVFLASVLAVSLLGIRLVVGGVYYSVLDLKRRYDRLNELSKSAGAWDVPGEGSPTSPAAAAIAPAAAAIAPAAAAIAPAAAAIAPAAAAIAEVIRGLREIEAEAAAIDEAAPDAGPAGAVRA
ncbi:MAG: hypothetical protein P4M00_24460 [Azospirillaceae bacterium]|nr:hypothetical protein [Azospirillaceae bacterium]